MTENICLYWRHTDELPLLICIMITRITLSELVQKQAVLVARREFQFPNALGWRVTGKHRKRKATEFVTVVNSHKIED